MEETKAFLAKFDLESPKDRSPEDLNSDLLEMSKAAEAAERYEDMCIFMTKLALNTLEPKSAESKRQFSVEERNLLSVAYKNVIGARRASWRTMLGVEEEPSPDSSEQLGRYKQQIQAELQMCSEQVLELLSSVLIPNCTNEEAKVFYLKMSGDYNRYLAEVFLEEKYGEAAKKDYSDAYKVAGQALLPTHPVRLGLALNFSVCFYEILKDPESACKMAKEAFDNAISELDALQEADYKDSTLIMQLLRDNLTLWTSQDQDDDDNVKVEDFEE